MNLEMLALVKLMLLCSSVFLFYMTLRRKTMKKRTSLLFCPGDQLISLNYEMPIPSFSKGGLGWIFKEIPPSLPLPKGEV